MREYFYGGTADNLTGWTLSQLAIISDYLVTKSLQGIPEQSNRRRKGFEDEEVNLQSAADPLVLEVFE